MKKFLAAISLLSFAFVAHAAEHRSYAIERFGAQVPWGAKQNSFPLVNLAATPGGTLSIAQSNLIDSLLPNRLPLLDNLLYESLMLPDPIAKTERMYPLIARSLRIDDELRYVVFELDPRARFQDRALIRGEDILFSIQEWKNASREFKERFESLVRAVDAQPQEVKFELKTTGQASRHAIMWLAAMKIVKTNTTGSPVVGGIKVEYTPSGPYRLFTLGRNRLSLIKDSFYWGAELPVRKGFFHLQQINLIASNDENSARMALLNQKANFFLETHPTVAPLLNAQLGTKNQHVKMVVESSATFMRKKPVLAFNLSRPVLHDWRVRQALMLAYDFDGMNQRYHAGKLLRPSHIAEASTFRPDATPRDEVRAIMSTCSLPDEAYGDFASYGHSLYTQIGDKRSRLLAAQNLMLKSGFKLENGLMKRSLPDGRFIPVILKAVIQNSDLRDMQLYQADLRLIGITLGITRIEGPANDYDLISGNADFLTKDGRPSAENLKLIESQRLPCLNTILDTLRAEPPYSDIYRDAVDAVSRITEALQLGIYTGEPKAQNFFVDDRLQIPTGLGLENAAMYGYWFDAQAEIQWMYPSPPYFGCMEISCMFGQRF